MSHTWVDGEVITAEKLNEISKEPLVIDATIEGDNIFHNVYCKFGYDGQVEELTMPTVMICDYDEYLNVYFIKPAGIYSYICSYNIGTIEPADISNHSANDLCIVKEVEALMLTPTHPGVSQNDMIFIIKDSSAIGHGTN